MVIKESFLLVADTTDILAAPSRLAAIPKNGVLTIEASATECNATNFGRLTLQLPDGDIPFQDLHIPANGSSLLDGVLDTRTQLTVTMVVGQGGHVGLNYDETAAVVLVLLFVTLTF